MKGFSPCDEQQVTLDEDTARRPLNDCDTACDKGLHQHTNKQERMIRTSDSRQVLWRTSSGLALKGWAKRMLSRSKCRRVQYSCQERAASDGKFLTNHDDLALRARTWCLQTWSCRGCYPSYNSAACY